LHFFHQPAEKPLALRDRLPDLDDDAVDELLMTLGRHPGPRRRPDESDRGRDGEREEARPPSLGYPPVRAEQLVVRSPASVKQRPPGKRPDSSPGEASAMASRNDRVISRRAGEGKLCDARRHGNAVADHPSSSGRTPSARRRD